MSIDVSESLPFVRGDAKRLGQVLDCLVENAIKFSPEGGRVKISVAERDDGLRFSVHDHGAGISAADCNRIFEKSYAMSARHSKEWGRHSATLLGLPLCHEIVAHHRGHIGAVSNVDGGAIFYFDLPICRSRVETDCDDAITPARRIRTLLVMANDVLAEAAQRALRLEDVDVEVCGHFQEALSIVQKWKPEVLVVSSNCLWQLSEGIEARLRRYGVGHIMMFSPFEGMVDLSAPTHSEPLLNRLSDLTTKGARVLLVEDDEEYATVIEFELSQAGVEALEMIEANAPDAMVLDLVLPRLDGFGVLETLVTKRSTVPAIVLTSLDDDRLEERLHALGAVGVFRKYELIQPRTTEHAARVRKALMPVLGVLDTNSNRRLAPRARTA
jgi:CheY-like chemotaxis protein